MKSEIQSEIKLSELAKKFGFDFTKKSDFALGWRSCYEFMAKDEPPIVGPRLNLPPIKKKSRFPSAISKLFQDHGYRSGKKIFVSLTEEQLNEFINKHK